MISNIQHTFIKLSVISETEIFASAKNHEELLKWWKEKKLCHPFNMFVADRTQQPNCAIIRLGLGFINQKKTVSKIFGKTFGESIIELPKSTESYEEKKEIVYKKVYKSSEDVIGKEYKLENVTYRIDSLISNQGSYGDVFKATSTKTNDIVAIKILRHDEDKEVDNFLKIKRIGKHPHIVSYIGSGRILEKTAIIMEYIEGTTLRRSEKELPNFEKQYRSAIEHLIKASVHLLDNHEENILVKESGDIVLIDFGTLGVK